MFTLINNGTEEGRSKIARLIALRDVVSPILANNLQTEFTDHTVEHSNQVAILVGKLASAVTPNLSVREAFILYAACYLHDIGMQYENAGSTSTVQTLRLQQPWNSLSREERDDLLRKVHPRLSAEMVRLSVRSATPPIGMQLTDDDSPAEIAALCEAHGVDLPEEEGRYAELIGSDHSVVRMGLLSGLLRMADILEESRRRAKRPKADTLLLPLVSRVHWWRHYYTIEVHFDDMLKSITLMFDFPPSKRNDYSRVVPQLQVPEIQKELRRHDRYFTRCGVNWVISQQIDSSPYGSAEDMPTDVFVEMSSWLQQSAEREVAARHQAVLSEYVSVQPAIAQRLNEINNLPADSSVFEKAEQLEAAANQLLSIGANHVARSVLQASYNECQKAGDAKRQLVIGLKLVPLMFRLGNYGLGCSIILECKHILKAVAGTQEQHLQVAQLVAQGFDTQCYFPDTSVAYQEAITAAQSQQKDELVNELTANLNEFMFLIDGSFADVTNEQFSGASTILIADVESKPSSHIRIKAIQARLLAQKGQVDDAIAVLNDIQLNCAPMNMFSWAFLVNTKADILHLSGNYQAALSLLTDALSSVPLSSQPQIHVTLQRNRFQCSLSYVNDDMMHWNNEMYDAEELANITNDNALTILEGISQQREGKHRNALANFWQELRSSYAELDWQRYCKAEEYVAMEYLSVGAVDEAECVNGFETKR